MPEVSVSAAPGTAVLDLDGVVYLGSTPIQGAAATINELLRLGWQVLFATNNSTKTPVSVTQTLESRVGLVVDPSTVVTSGMAVASYLGDNDVRSAFVVGSPELRETVRKAGIATVDSLATDSVVVGLDRNLSYETIAQAATAIRSGAMFVATNTDSTFPTPSGLVPGAGTVVAAVAAASGSGYVACGKPHEPMQRLLSSRIASPNVWMVGDRPETDIAFAKTAGWRSVLTLTGVTSNRVEVPVDLQPDYIVDSVADLVDTLTRHA